MTLRGKRIVVGVGGGIAAFKAVELVRELMRRGAEVRVAMTEAATRFVGPITFTGLTGRPPVVDIWDPQYPGEVHVELGGFADAMLVAPATANLLAGAAHGLANDAVLATMRCCDAPLFFAAAMHPRMWRSPATARAVALLEADGATMIGPVHGLLASGEQGLGRMREPSEIVDSLERALTTESRDLHGVRVLVSAGPTVEEIDPVRFLSNRSSGRMGYAIAERARARGASVTLISGPVSIAPPRGCELVQVRSALSMHQAIMSRRESVDVVIMAAAVADYRPAVQHTEKLKKAAQLTLELIKNPDILAELGEQRTGARPVLIGFALETNDLERYARDKLAQKRADLIVANHAADGLGGDDNRATLVSREGLEPLGLLPKRTLADRILDRAAALLSRTP